MKDFVFYSSKYGNFNSKPNKPFVPLLLSRNTSLSARKVPCFLIFNIFGFVF